MTKLTGRIKKQFITGFVVILPLGLTLWIAWIIFTFIGGTFGPAFDRIPYLSTLPQSARVLLSILATLIVIWLIGLWARNFAGKFILGNLDKLLLKTPLVSKIYSTMKQLTNMMFIDRQAFKKVAVIEYPRRGLNTIVFVTNENTDSPLEDKLTTVFVPSTPNPTTGFCIVLPKEDVHELDISVNQAIEFIFSGGMIVPGDLDIPVVKDSEKLKED